MNNVTEDIGAGRARFAATSIRLAARQPDPRSQLQSILAAFRQAFHTPQAIGAQINGVGRVPHEAVGESILVGQQGKFAGHFRISLLLDRKNRIHKLTIKVGGPRYVINYPSTVSPVKLERFVGNVITALESKYELN